MFDAMFLAFFHHNTSGFSMRFDDIAELQDQLVTDNDDDDGDEDETKRPRCFGSAGWNGSTTRTSVSSRMPSCAAERVMAELRVRPATRRSRRRRRSNHGDTHDLRRAVRAAMRRGGEPIDLLTTEPGPTSRAPPRHQRLDGELRQVLIRFAMRPSSAEATSRSSPSGLADPGDPPTRSPRPRDRRSCGRAHRGLVGRHPPRRFDRRVRLRVGHPRHGPRAIVVVLSDEQDRGEPTTMRDSMERLHRLCHKLIWVNPLKAGRLPAGSPGHGGRSAVLRRVPRGALPAFGE